MERPTTIRVIPFKMEHMDLLELRENESNPIFRLKDIHERIAIAKETSVETGTFISGGRIICCAGFYLLWPGVVDGWIIPSRYIVDSPYDYCKTMRRYIDSIMKTWECHRFQTVAAEGAERWMKFLGFEKEGVMRKYTHMKQNFGMYARVI